MMSCHFGKSLPSCLSSPPWPASAPLSRFCHCTAPHCTHSLCLSICLSVSLDAFGILRSPPPFSPYQPLLLRYYFHCTRSSSLQPCSSLRKKHPEAEAYLPLVASAEHTRPVALPFCTKRRRASSLFHPRSIHSYTLVLLSHCTSLQGRRNTTLFT
ncbi:hypothetical protein CGRA01v4_00191 [Colletotrichum graminicola]|nr:hypothetical protein CGRA01v4_00191 [Colletotrichum graminicola]